MPRSARRTGAITALMGLLLLLATPAAGAGTSRTVRTDSVGGVDIDAVVADLGDDHLALVGAVGEPEAAWAAVVTDARGANLSLWLVVLGTAPVGATPSDVADAVLGQVKGTILVLSPATPDGHTVGLASNDVGQSEVDAVEADLDGGAPTPATAQAVVDQLTDAGFPWLLVVVGGLIVLLCLGVAYGLWRGRRHRRERGEESAELTSWLRARHSELADRLDDLTGPLTATGRGDLRSRLQVARAGIESIAVVLDRESLDRAGVDAVAGSLATLDAEIAALREAVDGADVHGADLDATD